MGFADFIFLRLKHIQHDFNRDRKFGMVRDFVHHDYTVVRHQRVTPAARVHTATTAATAAAACNDQAQSLSTIRSTIRATTSPSSATLLIDKRVIFGF